MITFIAFILTILGCLNWLLIGLLQYDFIAGLFGFQASIFSRIVYIIFGIGAVYTVIRTIINKGTFKIYEKRKKKLKEPKLATANVEAGKEQIQNTENQNKQEKQEQQNQTYNHLDENSLFDEHFNSDIK
ncbi:MAG: DUF378 domain-containing protein [Clostridia bacterium]|nr:DUF378 domain-containing protein [Clostridia bacterium]